MSRFYEVILVLQRCGIYWTYVISITILGPLINLHLPW